MKRRQFLKHAGIAAAGIPFGLGLISEEVKAKVPSGLKITGLKIFPFQGYGQSTLYVKVLTNEGITGLGEGALWTNTSVAALKEYEPYIIGHDPTDIEFLWRYMYQVPFWRGGVILMSAISAIDIACWDIMGKIADLPIYKLLGGRARDKIRLYAHGGRGTPEQAAESILRIKEQGFTAMKSGPSADENRVVQQPWGLKRSVEIFKAMRDAVGDDFDIAIDAHAKLTPDECLEYANAIEPYRPMFIEEPVPPGNLDMFEWLTNRTNVPLATGERLYTKYEFRPLIERELVTYLQPDVLHVGGITELHKIAVMAEANMIKVAPHNPNGIVSTLASMHVNASCHTAVILETQRVTQPQPWQEDLHYGVTISHTDGYAPLPDQPGLGVDLDEKVVQEHPRTPRTGGREYNREDSYRLNYEDGSIWEP
ncbi:galactonate dehydratase [Candidatus Latescibacterota bacterium]